MKASLVLLSLAALTFAGISAGLFFSRPPDHSNRVAELELKLKEADAEIARLKAEAAKPKPHPGATALSAARAASSADGRDEAAKDAGSAAKDSKSSITQMMKSPAMREMVKAQQGMQIEMQYARLFTNLGLDDTEKSHFKKLITDRASAKMDMGFKLMESTLTKDQRKAITDDFDLQKKASDEAIRTFLNDENDYKTFQHWEDTEPERMQMMMGRGAFEGAGVPLSTDQEEQLVSLMAEVRKKPSALPDLTDPKNITPEAIGSEDMIKKITAKAASDAEAIRKGAAAFLSPEQLAALAKYQDQMKAMTEMGLKMSRSMLGNDKK